MLRRSTESAGDRGSRHRSRGRPAGGVGGSRAKAAVPRCLRDRRVPAAEGFSLLEMLIVVTVFGIMATVAVPLFLKDDPAADVRHAADRLANVLRQARFRAVSLKRPVHVEVEPGGNDDFYTAYADHDGDGAASGTGPEIAATRITFPDRAGGVQGVSLPAGVQFDRGAAASSPDDDAGPPGDAVDLPTNPLVFRPRGTVEWPDAAPEPSAGLYLSHADDPEIVYAVVVMPTGAIKTWRLDDGGWR